MTLGISAITSHQMVHKIECYNADCDFRPIPLLFETKSNADHKINTVLLKASFIMKNFKRMN